MRAGGVGISGQQSIDRLLRQQTAGPAEVIQEIRIIRMRGQCRLQICDRLGQLPGLDLRDSQRGLVCRTRWRCGIASAA